jgi:hypothetical protein
MIEIAGPEQIRLDELVRQLLTLLFHGALSFRAWGGFLRVKGGHGGLFLPRKRRVRGKSQFVKQQDRF